jgi:tRNA (guanine26-N2/guanine27-N2)-dimethyltransferase
MRAWVKLHPVKMENIKQGSPARVLLSKTQKLVLVFPSPFLQCLTLDGRSSELETVRTEISFEPHPDVGEAILESVKVVRYQQNPTPNWGPQARAVRGRQQGKKRKELDEGDDARPTAVKEQGLEEEMEKEDDGSAAPTTA